MQHLNYPQSQYDTPPQACMFVDYENLYSYLNRSHDQRSHAKEVINSLISSSVQHVTHELKFQLSSPTAYADFSTMGSDGSQIQKSLYLDGMQPQFVPASLQPNASEIQICIDVLETLQNDEQISAIFLVSADRLYLPLINYCQHYNALCTVISFHPPNLSPMDEHSGRFVSASQFIQKSPPPHYQEESTPMHSHEGVRTASPPMVEIKDDLLLSALHVIIYFFGQYEDVFLTPLLRKLAEMLPDFDDSKYLITQLTESGAVWLEKRPGFPYNYTVLLVNYQHPDVLEAQDAIEKSRYVEEEAYQHLRENQSEVHDLTYPTEF